MDSLLLDMNISNLEKFSSDSANILDFDLLPSDQDVDVSNLLEEFHADGPSESLDFDTSHKQHELNTLPITLDDCYIQHNQPQEGNIDQILTNDLAPEINSADYLPLIESNAIWGNDMSAFGLEDNLDSNTNLFEYENLASNDNHFITSNVYTNKNYLSESSHTEDTWESSEHHQFFLAMEKKWYLNEEDADFEQRFLYISNLLKTKSPEQVKEYFNKSLKRVRDSLRSVNYELNIRDPEDVRLGLWSWYLVMVSYGKKGEHIVRLDDPVEYKHFSMSLFSAFTKHRRKAFVTIESVERKRSQSGEINSAVDGVNKRPPIVNILPAKLSKTKKRTIEKENCSNTTQTFKRLSSCGNSNVKKTMKKNQASSSCVKPKNRIALILRLLPINTMVRNLVDKAGFMTKVQLTFKGTKKIADICEHMMMKWSVVMKDFSKDSEIRFYPVGDRTHPGWGRNDISVTCLDIANQFGEVNGNEASLSLEYKIDGSSVVVNLSDMKFCHPLLHNTICSETASNSSASQIIDITTSPLLSFTKKLPNESILPHTPLSMPKELEDNPGSSSCDHHLYSLLDDSDGEKEMYFDKNNKTRKSINMIAGYEYNQGGLLHSLDNSNNDLNFSRTTTPLEKDRKTRRRITPTLVSNN